LARTGSISIPIDLAGHRGRLHRADAAGRLSLRSGDGARPTPSAADPDRARRRAFWTSFLIRVYAWIALLKDEGLINHALMALHLIDAPLSIYATNVAVVIGIVYSYLPFMLLPLYAALERQDPALREAAADLGASPAQVFWALRCRFRCPGRRRLPARFHSGGRRIRYPDLLGGSETLMIGKTLWTDFFANRDWLRRARRRSCCSSC